VPDVDLLGSLVPKCALNALLIQLTRNCSQRKPIECPHFAPATKLKLKLKLKVKLEPKSGKLPAPVLRANSQTAFSSSKCRLVVMMMMM